MNKQTFEMLSRVERMGVSTDDAFALRRISMTLQRWHELECGTDNGCIERDEVSGKPFMVWYSNYDGNRHQSRIADRESGALKRLNTIMAKYPELSAYVQTDPRGAALYIYRKDNEQLKNAKYGIESVYSSVGVALYK